MKRKKKLIALFLVLITICLIFRIFCGIFVIQPIGVIPKGATIIYWRTGLNMPFIASVDGILEESGAGVSLLGRGLTLAKLAEPIKKRELFRIKYSETLYLKSTKGKKYDR